MTEDGLMLSSTIGPVEAGIVDALEESFTRQTGISVRHVAMGSGKGLAMARNGGIDLLLAHAPADEEAFVADGCGTGRYPLMYNDFVLVGPDRDPAWVRGCTRAAAALEQIAVSGSPFITRGDRSGTHLKELDVWRAAGLVPSGAWYQTFAQGDQGNTATLRFAERLQAYTLIDRATLLAVRAQGLSLQVLLEGDPLLTNLFSLIPVAPACSGRGRLAEAEAFVSWATGAEGRALIAAFGRERFGEPLFYLVG